jgi:hypothetical protein
MTPFTIQNIEVLERISPFGAEVKRFLGRLLGTEVSWELFRQYASRMMEIGKVQTNQGVG